MKRWSFTPCEIFQGLGKLFDFGRREHSSRFIQDKDLHISIEKFQYSPLLLLSKREVVDVGPGSMRVREPLRAAQRLFKSFPGEE